MLAKLPANRQALLTAADLIELHGHAKLTRLDSRGAMCVLGAISAAATGDAERLSNISEPCATFERFMRSRGTNAVDWNNADERTREEVIAALREAALEGM